MGKGAGDEEGWNCEAKNGAHPDDCRHWKNVAALGSNATACGWFYDDGQGRGQP